LAAAARGLDAVAPCDGGRERADFDYREGMPRIPSPVVVFLAAIAAAAPISACNSRPKVEAPDEAIVGEWKCPANGSAVTFSSSGLYSLTLKDQPRPVMGSFKFDPEEGMLTLQTRRESPFCADDIGSYRVHIGGVSLDSELVRDTCEKRAKIFAVRFERSGSPRPAGAK
jgi:hypothetical protein